MWSDELFSVSRKILINQLLIRVGGEGGIRTHRTLTRTPDFESTAFRNVGTYADQPAKAYLRNAGWLSIGREARHDKRLYSEVAQNNLQAG